MYEAFAMTLTMERLTAFFSGVEPSVAETQPNICGAFVRTSLWTQAILRGTYHRVHSISSTCEQEAGDVASCGIQGRA